MKIEVFTRSSRGTLRDAYQSARALRGTMVEMSPTFQSFTVSGPEKKVQGFAEDLKTDSRFEVTVKKEDTTPTSVTHHAAEAAFERNQGMATA